MVGLGKKVCVYFIFIMAKKIYNKYRVRTRTRGGDELLPKSEEIKAPQPFVSTQSEKERQQTLQTPVSKPVTDSPTPVPEKIVSNIDEKGCPKKPWWKFWAGKRSSKRTMKKRCYKNKTSKKNGKSRRCHK